MLKGKVSRIGTMEIDGEEATGVFVECNIDDLRNVGKNMFGKNVYVEDAIEASR